MRLLIKFKRGILGKYANDEEWPVKLKQTLIVEIGLSLLSQPIQENIAMRICIPSLTRDL